jgi:hypothetical protein
MPSYVDRHHTTSRPRPGLWIVLAGIVSIGALVAAALFLASVREDTRIIERRVEAAGQPCVWLANGDPSPGCDQLAMRLAETCARTPSLCKQAVEKAAKAIPFNARRKFKSGVEDGLAAAGLRGMVTPVTPGRVRQGARDDKSGTGGSRAPQGRQKPDTGPRRANPPRWPNPSGSPAAKSPPAAGSPRRSDPSPSQPPSPPSRSGVTVPDAPPVNPPVDTPDLPQLPSPTSPVPPEVPRPTLPDVVPELPVVPGVGLGREKDKDKKPKP